MTKDEKIKILKECFEDTIWMSIRYAHGRSTYAPSMVRLAVNNFKKVFPDWKPKEDITIKDTWEVENESIISLREDYLNDLFDN
jgi:hypothetical protein